MVYIKHMQSLKSEDASESLEEIHSGIVSSGKSGFLKLWCVQTWRLLKLERQEEWMHSENMWTSDERQPQVHMCIPKMSYVSAPLVLL